MIKYKYLSILLFSCFMTYAQQKNDQQGVGSKGTFIFELGTFYTPLLNKDFMGGGMDFKYYLSKRFCTGISIYASSKRTSDEFGYEVKKPRLDYAGINLLSELNIVNRRLLRVNLILNNGFAQAELVDRSEKIKTGNPNVLLAYHAKSIDHNNCYVLEPGFNLSLLLQKENNIYLTLISKYRLAFGNTPLGSNALMSGYQVGLGITFLYPD